MGDFAPFFFSSAKWEGAVFSPPMKNPPGGIVSEMIEFSTGTVEARILFFSARSELLKVHYFQVIENHPDQLCGGQRTGNCFNRNRDLWREITSRHRFRNCPIETREKFRPIEYLRWITAALRSTPSGTFV